MPQALASTIASGSGRSKSLATVTGSVRDSQGNPLAGALVSFLREGADEVAQQTKSVADGTFKARVAPGRYLLRAVAEGFNSATFTAVQISPSSELVYRFNLEPAGQGQTAPERRPDRHDAKFRIRSSHSRRSIFQIDEEEDATVRATQEALAQESASEETEGLDQIAGGEEIQRAQSARPQGVVETFFTSSADGRAAQNIGLNFAVASPVNESFDLIFAGQLGALDRLETTARFRIGNRHQVRATFGGARLSVPRQDHLTPLRSSVARGALGQVSLRAVDEWVVHDGIVVVLGLDYSRFVGGSNAAVLSPRIGVQFDANARTRFSAAYAPGGGDEAHMQSVAYFEDAAVVFREPAPLPVAVMGGKALMERSRRLEFGVERLLDEHSSVEATAFFDTTDGRGVGLLSTPLNAFANGNGTEMMRLGHQQGAARGLRVVYKRRLGSFMKASAGYAFGRGQELAGDINQPAQIFQNGFFHTAAAQFDADVRDGMRVRTVLRFSPSATVFAIDPFAGRLAVYDPSLSILVTQELPTFGLPLRAEAVVDARNILDALKSVEDGENLLSVNATRRMLRYGISVRF